MEASHKFNQEVTINFNQMSINEHRELVSNICVNEDQHFMPLEIVELIFKSLSTIEDIERASLVCKDWKQASIKPIEVAKILQWPFACEQWEKEYPNFEMFPRLDKSEEMIRKLIKFGTSNCPFSEGKSVMQTHLMIYIGTEFRSKVDNSILPVSISLFKGQIMMWQRLSGGLLAKTILKKPKFVAIYRDSLAILRDKGESIEPTQNEKEKGLKANELGYRLPTILELGIAINTIPNSNNSQNTIWLTEARNRFARCEDLFIENDHEDQIYMDSSPDGNSFCAGANTRGQLQYFNGLWNNGTFGIMVCKDFEEDVECDNVDNVD